MHTVWKSLFHLTLSFLKLISYKLYGINFWVSWFILEKPEIGYGNNRFLWNLVYQLTLFPVGQIYDLTMTHMSHISYMIYDMTYEKYRDRMKLSQH